MRTTVSEMGPLLLGQLLGLSEAQEGIINIAFRVADGDGMPLLDLKDLQALLVLIGENAKDLSLRYGNVSSASVGAIQRRLLVLENQCGTKLFGEPALALSDLMRTDADGRGMINILASDQLMGAPKLYATFLLWLLSELFEELPEVGDADKPKLVFFFDKAHHPIRWRAQSVGRQARAGRPPHSLQRGRCLFHHPKPGGCARGHPRPAW